MDTSQSEFERRQDAVSDPFDIGVQGEMRDFLLALRRGWWVIALCGLVAAVAASYAMAQRTPQYTAQVLLRRASSAPLVSLDPGSGQGSDFGSQLEVIRSRAVLGPVVDSLDLELEFPDRPVFGRLVDSARVEEGAPWGSYLFERRGGRSAIVDPRSKEPVAVAGPGGDLRGPGFVLWVGPDAPAPAEPLRFQVTNRERALEKLQGRVRVEPGKGADLIRVTYSDPDPTRAAAVANAVAASYIRYGALSARDAAARRKEFLAEQLVQLADSVQRSESTFLRWQEQEGLLNPQAVGGALAAELTQAENLYRSYDTQKAMLQSLLASLGSPAAADAGMQRIMATGREVLPGGAELYSRIVQLEMERNRLTASRFGHTERSPQVEVVDSLMAATRSQIRVLAEESIGLTEERQRQAGARMAQLRGEIGGIPQRSAEFARLQQGVTAVKSVFDMLVEKYYEAQLAEAVEAGDVELVDEAPVPQHAQYVNRPFGVGVAFCVGIMLGVGGVGIRRYMDGTIQRVVDVQRAVGLPVIGLIPHMEGKPDERTPGKLAGVEAFRTLAASLWLGRPEGMVAIAITSAAPKEGKSTIAANLAIALAQMGSRVLLVDGDLRRPVVHRVFDTDVAPGFSEVVQGQATLEEVVRHEGRFGVHILTRGSPVGNPTSLVTGAGFANLLDRLRELYDMVVIDTSPVLAVAEAAVFAARADRVILTAWADGTERAALREAADRLRAADAPLFGVVITSVPTSAAYGRSAYGYYQYSGYHAANGSDADAAIRRRRLRLVGGPNRSARPADGRGETFHPRRGA